MPAEENVHISALRGRSSRKRHIEWRQTRASIRKTQNKTLTKRRQRSSEKPMKQNMAKKGTQRNNKRKLKLRVFLHFIFTLRSVIYFMVYILIQLLCSFFPRFFTFYDLHNFFLFEFNSHILYFDFFCVSAIIYMFSTWCSLARGQCSVIRFCCCRCRKFRCGYLSAIVTAFFILIAEFNLYNFHFSSFSFLNSFCPSYSFVFHLGHQPPPFTMRKRINGYLMCVACARNITTRCPYDEMNKKNG